MRGDDLHLVLATPFQITPQGKRALHEAGIHHIRLGPGFKEFCANVSVPRDTDPPDDVL